MVGSPRITIRMRPACDYGARRPRVTYGSNHVCYVMPGFVLRVTTDSSVTAILEETQFFLQDTLSLVMGPDESLTESVADTAHRFLDETAAYWREWVRALGIPFEWQDEIIRAVITIKLNAFDDTGAIIAAVTTSIPESATGGRNWDYRYCWLRDAYFVVNAFNRLSATRTMERYLAFIINLTSTDSRLQPVYQISGRADIEERTAPALPGYRGLGPVRVGNLAYRRRSTMFTAPRFSRQRTSFSTSGWRARAMPHCSATWKVQANKPCSCMTSRTRDFGNCAARSGSILFPASCAGWRATASRRSPCGSG